jgi:ACS family hexuronate transporter-like MFS transporter
MLKDKRIISLCTARFISDWAWWFFLFWTPSYLKDAFGLDLSEVKYPLIIIYTVASLGGISGGLISSAIIKREKSLLFARKKSLFVFASFVVPVVLCGFIKEFWVVIACISLAAAAHQGWAANVFTIVSDVFSKKSVASVTGLCSFAGALGGTIFSAAVGFIREWRGDYLIVFFMIPIVYFTAWLIVYFFYKPAKQSL